MEPMLTGRTRKRWLQLIVRYATGWSTGGRFWTDGMATALHERQYISEQTLPIPGMCFATASTDERTRSLKIHRIAGRNNRRAGNYYPMPTAAVLQRTSDGSGPW